MQSGHSKKISILIVPEDNAEPYSFRLKTSTAKILYVVGALLVVHIIAGAIFYWKYAELLKTNQNLAEFNLQLQRDNKRVIELADKLYSLEMEYRKVRSLLGVEQAPQSPVNGLVEARSFKQKIESLAPAGQRPGTRSKRFVSTDTRRLLMRRKTKLHNYVQNLPTLLPVVGYLTLDFQKGGWLVPKSHTGIDIVARKGTVIRAAGAGVVIFSNWTLDLGYLIIIDHGNGLLTYYGHNQRLLRPEKSYVQKGEPIALLGSSGHSSGPHLHFEIWENGVPVDPKKYILAFRDNES